MNRPAWTLIYELQMFAYCRTDRKEIAIEIVNRLVNITYNPITNDE